MPPLRQTVWPAVAVSKAFCRVFQGSARVPGFFVRPGGGNIVGTDMSDGILTRFVGLGPCGHLSQSSTFVTFVLEWMREIPTKGVRHETLLGLHSSLERETAAMLGVAFLWLSTATAAATKIKTRVKNRELETTPLSKVRAPLLPQVSLKNLV